MSVASMFLGSQPTTSNYRHDDSGTEERIAAILTDAQRAIQAKQCQEKVNTDPVR